jgi:drug/metabolite transporter (DMT)-like permease
MNRLAVLALIGSGVAWGAGFPLGKRAMEEIGAGQLVTLRFVIAALAALPFALATKEARALFRSPALLAAGALYGLAFQVQFEGLARTSVTLSALLVGAFPALIAVGARLLGEHIPRLSWAGVAAATLGAALIAGKPSAAGGSTLGVVLALLALLIFIAWLFLLRLAPKGPTAMAVPAATVIVAAATMAPVALLLHGPPPLQLSPAAWGAVLAQALVCTLFATAAWQYGLSRVGSATAGVFVNLEPLIGSMFGVAFFGDRLTLGLIVGGLLVLAGSYVTVLGESKQPKTDLAHNPATPA